MSQTQETQPQNSKPDVQSDPEPATDGRLPSSAMRSYALLTPDIKNLYMSFYKATYGKSKLDIKTKEFVAIAASLVAGCRGCLEGHLKKAKKEGATAEEISEVIAITLGVLSGVHASAGSDWPGFLGPTGDGKSTETGILESWKAGGHSCAWPLRFTMSAGHTWTRNGRCCENRRT